MNTTTGGLNLTTFDGYVPKEQYTFSLNSMLSLSSVGTREIYMGNEVYNNLIVNGNQLSIIGSYLLPDNSFILFLTDNTNHSIGILSNGSYTELYNNPLLNFNTKYAINTDLTIYRNKDRVVYFTDYNNPVRLINIDEINLTTDIHSLLVFPDFKESKLKVNVNTSGGHTKTGYYGFAMRYLINGYYTNWFILNREVYNYREVNNRPFLNSDYNEDYTNNSIKLELEGLDTRFESYQLAIIIRSSGAGTNNDVFVLEERKIRKENDNYIYTGKEQVDITTYKDLIVNTIKLEKVLIVKSYDNRMLYANTDTSSKVDKAKLQYVANNIGVKYVVGKLSYNEYDKRKPVKGFMRDEVYAFALTIKFKDGNTYSYHIPALQKDSIDITFANTNISDRPPANITWHSEVITPQVKPSDILFLNNLERWNVYNTAVREQSINFLAPEYPISLVYKGSMGYYECEDTYPDDKDLDGNYIYPHSIINGEVVFDKIRHHRIPDNNLETHFTVENDIEYILPIGIEFSGLEIPIEFKDEIESYSYSVAINDDYSVIDRAIMTEVGINYINEKVGWWRPETFNKGAYLLPSIPFGRANGFSCSINLDDGGQLTTPTDIVGLYTPTSKFLNTNVNAQYIKLEGQLANKEIWVDRTENRFLGSVSFKQMDTLIQNLQLNYEIESNFYADYNIIVNNNTLGIIAAQPTYIFHIGSRQSVQYAKLGSLTPYNNNLLDWGQYGDESSIPNVKVVYCTLKDEKSNMLSSLNNLIYRTLNPNEYIPTFNVIGNVIQPYLGLDRYLFNGDCFITKWDIRKSLQNYEEETGGLNYRMTKLDDKNSNVTVRDNAYISTNIQVFIDSRINTEMREMTDSISSSYYSYFPRILLRENHTTDGVDTAEAYTISKDYQKTNLDLSSLLDLKVSIGYTPDKYNKDRLPYRIWFSERVLNEDKEQGYRKILSNSYRDIITTYGEITNVVSLYDNLLCHTPNALYNLPTKPQVLETTNNTVFIGNGDFLSIPEKAMTTIVYGYAGLSNWTYSNITEAGYLFVNEDRNKLFLMNDKLMEISLFSIQNFSNENVKLFLKEQIKEVGQSYNFINTVTGTGFRTWYDKLNNLFLISKIDYEYIGEYPLVNWEESSRDEPVVKYNSDTNIFYLESQSVSPISLNNKEYFRDRSFTLSGYLQGDKIVWNSFHSFKPKYILEDKFTYYTVFEKVWKHYPKAKLSEYYGIKYPFVIEVVLNDEYVERKKLSHIVTDVKFSTNKPEITKFFTKIWLYNYLQSTGYIDLQLVDSPQMSVSYNTTKFKYKKGAEEYTINNFRDITVDKLSNTFSEDWDVIKLSIDEYGYNNVAPINIDYNRNVFTRDKMDSKYLRLRLVFKDVEDVQLNLRWIVAFFNKNIV